MFEHRSQPLAHTKVFYRRALRFALAAIVLLGLSLLAGMAGYHYLAQISWVDAYYNAAMILTGMGPALDINDLAPERQNTVKIFAGTYAMYSGVVFLAASGLVLSPLLHRFFHKLHLDIQD